MIAVYILTNRTYGTLYTGSTGNLAKRIEQHKAGKGSEFTAKYRCKILVYAEVCEDINVAREREYQIKQGSRKKKIALIESINQEWNDMACGAL